MTNSTFPGVSRHISGQVVNFIHSQPEAPHQCNRIGAVIAIDGSNLKGLLLIENMKDVVRGLAPVDPISAREQRLQSMLVGTRIYGSITPSDTVAGEPYIKIIEQ